MTAEATPAATQPRVTTLEAILKRFGDDPSSAWGSSWPSIIPLGGGRRAFAVDVPQGKPLFRFAAAHKAGFHWGFLLKDAAVPSTGGPAAPCEPRGPSPTYWLKKSMDAVGFPREASGAYRVTLASDDRVEVHLQSEHDVFRGRWTFKRADGGWECSREAMQTGMVAYMGHENALRALMKSGVRRAALPVDPTNGLSKLKIVNLKQSAQSSIGLRFLVKQAEEQRYTLGVGYPANEVDVHGEYASPEELERAAWRFMRTRKVGLMHRKGTDGAGEVVESYIYRGPEWEVGGQKVNPGDWLVGVIWEPEAWEMIKQGAIAGYSMQGWAKQVE